MIILTPNRRLAAFSRQQYNAAQAAAGHVCWPSVEIFPLEVWLLQLWDLCLDHNNAQYKPLITSKQQQLLFEQIIQTSSTATELLRINATAQNAIQAWKFLQQWQVGLAKLAAYADYTADTAAFYTWIQAYLQWLDVHAYTDFHLMVDALIAIVPEIIELLPAKICLRGFNEQTPQYARLFAKFAEYGMEIINDQLTVSGAEVARCGLATNVDEFAAAAAWAHTQFQINDQQIIGVVIPDLEAQRANVHDEFHKYFPAHAVNISAPLPLADYPIIASALQILSLATSTLNYTEFSALLRSPHIVDYSRESQQRALLDRRLRETLEAKVRWEQILALLSEECPSLKNCIIAFTEQLSDLQGKHAAQYWIDKLQKLLQCWGWPGERLALDPLQNSAWLNLAIQESDLLTCWRAVLEEYSKLSLVIPPHTFSEALQFVRRLTHETPFLPAETGLTKVHVLGMLEAEGLVFDKLWVCGMSRDSWPPAANPNPFIPLELQRQFDLPHSSAQRELAMAKKYTANLQQGARQQVIFSYAEFVEEQKVAPSNLIAHLPVFAFNVMQTEQLFTYNLEAWQDLQTAPYAEAYVGGGAASLRLQAQCPFKANAELRLGAQPLATPQNILTPMLRGTLVHEVLEEFWRHCQSHAQLLIYTTEELTQFLNKIIQDILAAWQRVLPNTLTNNYIMLEAHRLYNLIARWLEYEAGREPFIVYQLEQKTLISIGPLQVNMKMDRIDQVNNGFVIIDYKTGLTQYNQWFTDPIYEPQLPLYAVSAGKDVVAVAFANLRAQELKFSGIAADDGILPHVKASDGWHRIQQEWRHRLEHTAADFVAGNAAVTPYSPVVCSTCHLQAFCRIYEQ